jgi:hypothetical protein
MGHKQTILIAEMGHRAEILQSIRTLAIGPQLMQPAAALRVVLWGDGQEMRHASFHDLRHSLADIGNARRCSR